MQSDAHFLHNFFNLRMSLAVAFSGLSVYVSVCNKCVVDRGPLGYFWTVGLLPQILKVVWPAPLISVFSSFTQLFICKGLSILVPVSVV